MEEERAHAKPARGAPGENVGAPTFKVLLEGYLILTKLSNEFADVLKGQAVNFGDSNGRFPKMKKELEGAMSGPVRRQSGGLRKNPEMHFFRG